MISTLFRSKKIALFFCIFSISCSLFTQEKMGIVNDNYLPLHQYRLNPAAIVDQKPKISFSFIGVESYARTNFLYIHERISPSASFDDIKYKQSTEIMKGFAVAEINLPSISIVKGNHSFAFHSRARSYSFVNNVPSVVGKIIAEESVEEIFDGLYVIENARAKSMSWAEAGLTYGRILWKGKDNSLLSGAITINRLFGAQQSSFYIDKGRVEVIDGEGVLINVNGEYSFTDFEWQAGKGWSTNLGFVYKKLKDDAKDYIPHSKLSDCRRSEYKYKFGFSLLDFGNIHFDKGAYHTTFDERVEIKVLEEEFTREDVREEAELISADEFDANLPSAVSVQMDYNLNKGFYINATMVHSVPNKKSFGVERASFLALSPRFERRRIGFAFPISVLDYTDPQIGFALRLGPVSIGTEHILSFLTPSDIYGADFYFNINFQVFNSAKCKK